MLPDDYLCIDKSVVLHVVDFVITVPKHFEVFFGRLVSSAPPEIGPFVEAHA